MVIQLDPIIAIVIAAGLLLLAFYVFARVRSDYRARGLLSRPVAILQTGYFFIYALSSYLFLDSRFSAITSKGALLSFAILLMVVGLSLVLLSMPFLGRRSFGAVVGQLHTQGIYRFSRNPQLVGSFIFIVGYVLLWPSLIGALWAALWLKISYWMVRAEEEHLRSVFGKEYQEYCRRTPRFIGLAKDSAMRQITEFSVKLALLAMIWLSWWWAINATLSNAINLSIIVGGLILVFPLVWLGRKILDRRPTIDQANWTTTFVHVALGFLFGIPIIRAITTHQDWTGWKLPIPSEIGLVLVIISGVAFLLTVLNLALKGLGAPFYLALSQKLAVDWMYAWTRNPMVLAALAFLLSLGIWFQSALFVLWALLLFSPALLFFVKVYEERELEIRFGAPYLEYKSRTPMLFPRRLR